jgi:hypothetical protein
MVHAAAFSPDSRFLMVGDGRGERLIVWDLAGDTRAFELRGTPLAMMGADFLDENTVLSWALDGTVRVWDLHTQSIARRVVFSRSRVLGS